MITAQRRNDAVLTLCQDNARKTVAIEEANSAVSLLTGFEQGELVGAPLAKILPSDLQSELDEELEYNAAGSDLAEVLGKFRQVSLKTRDGAKFPLDFKIFRVDTADGRPRFQLVMRDGSLGQEIEVSKQGLAGHETLDSSTELPTRASFEKDLEMVIYYVSTRAVDACCAVVEVDDFKRLRKNHGQGAANAVIRAVAALFKSKLRAEDSVCYLGGARLAILLTGANHEGAKIVLNRLRWLVGSNKIHAETGQEMHVSISAGFCEIHKGHYIREVLLLCETALAWAVESGGDFVQEAN